MLASKKDLMETDGAKRVLRACTDKEIEDYDGFYQKIYLCEEDLGISDIDHDFMLWVIANDRMKGSRCYGCGYAADQCFTYINNPMNHCNSCAYNPNPMLPVKYVSAEKRFS